MKSSLLILALGLLISTVQAEDAAPAAVPATDFEKIVAEIKAGKIEERVKIFQEKTKGLTDKGPSGNKFDYSVFSKKNTKFFYEDGAEITDKAELDVIINKLIPAAGGEVVYEYSGMKKKAWIWDAGDGYYVVKKEVLGPVQEAVSQTEPAPVAIEKKEEKSTLAEKKDELPGDDVQKALAEVQKELGDVAKDTKEAQEATKKAQDAVAKKPVSTKK